MQIPAAQFGYFSTVFSGNLSKLRLREFRVVSFVPLHLINRHSGEGRNPILVRKINSLDVYASTRNWIPAFAGMTLYVVLFFLAHIVAP
jgi:hypothetical protein